MSLATSCPTHTIPRDVFATALFETSPSPIFCTSNSFSTKPITCQYACRLISTIIDMPSINQASSLLGPLPAGFRLASIPYPDFDVSCSEVQNHTTGTWCPLCQQCGMPWNTELPFPGSEEDDDLECIDEVLVGPPGSVLEGVYVEEPLQIETIALIISTKLNGRFKCPQLDLASKRDNFETLEEAADRLIAMRSVLLQFQSGQYTPPSCFLILERALRWPEESADELLNTFFLPKPQVSLPTTAPPPPGAAVNNAIEDLEEQDDDESTEIDWQIFPDQDLTPAWRGVPETHKFFLVCVQVGGTEDKIFRFPGWRTFDWTDKKSLIRLNKFRRQVNDRYGGEKEEKGKPWTQMERHIFKQLTELVIEEGKVNTRGQHFDQVSERMTEFFNDLVQLAGVPLAVEDSKKKKKRGPLAVLGREEEGGLKDNEVGKSDQDDEEGAAKDSDDEDDSDDDDDVDGGSKVKIAGVSKEDRVGHTRTGKTLNNKAAHFHDINIMVTHYTKEGKARRVQALAAKKGKIKGRGKGAKEEGAANDKNRSCQTSC